MEGKPPRKNKWSSKPRENVSIAVGSGRVFKLVGEEEVLAIGI
jgi:hypothetical protein